MKIIPVAMMLVLLAAGCATPREANRSAVSLKGQREVVMTVHGLSCPLCSNNLSGRLRKIKGVDNVAIDLNTGEVRLELAEGHDVSEWNLASAVESAGFTLVDVRLAGEP